MKTLINRGYKFKIVPTKEQEEFFLQSFGCARKIYNMYVDELYRKLEETGYQNGVIKKSELHLSKYTDFSKQFDYMKNVDAQCLSSAKMDFNNAITKYPNLEYRSACTMYLEDEVCRITNKKNKRHIHNNKITK